MYNILQLSFNVPSGPASITTFYAEYGQMYIYPLSPPTHPLHRYHETAFFNNEIDIENGASVQEYSKIVRDFSKSIHFFP